jgi:hypothetical protein
VVLIKVLVDTHATGCKTQQLSVFMFDQLPHNKRAGEVAAL